MCYKPVQDRQTNGQTGKTCNAAYGDNHIIMSLVNHNNRNERILNWFILDAISIHG